MEGGVSWQEMESGDYAKSMVVLFWLSVEPTLRVDGLGSGAGCDRIVVAFVVGCGESIGRGRDPAAAEEAERGMQDCFRCCGG